MVPSLFTPACSLGRASETKKRRREVEVSGKVILCPTSSPLRKRRKGISVACFLFLGIVVVLSTYVMLVPTWSLGPLRTAQSRTLEIVPGVSSGLRHSIARAICQLSVCHFAYASIVIPIMEPLLHYLLSYLWNPDPGTCLFQTRQGAHFCGSLPVCKALVYHLRWHMMICVLFICGSSFSITAAADSADCIRH
jgi:hypothetical protein